MENEEDKYLDWLLDRDRAFKDDPPPADDAPEITGLNLQEYMDADGYKFWCCFCKEPFHEKDVKQWRGKTDPKPECPMCGVTAGALGWGDVKI